MRVLVAVTACSFHTVCLSFATRGAAVSACVFASAHLEIVVKLFGAEALTAAARRRREFDVAKRATLLVAELMEILGNDMLRCS